MSSVFESYHVSVSGQKTKMLRDDVTSRIYGNTANLDACVGSVFIKECRSSQN